MNKSLCFALGCLLAGFVHAGEHKGPPPRAMATFDQMDSDHDGKVTFEEFKDALSKLAQDRFGRIDRDDNGTVSQDELRGAAKHVADVNPEMAERFKRFVPEFEAMDKDGSGGLSLDEFTTGITHNAMEKFEKADRNADDVLTREELEQGLALLRERAVTGDKALRKADKKP